MADRYWVGGTATWDATVGTKWATTSGGAGGASVPTGADDVFFTNLSTGTCTIATGMVAKSINCTGFAGSITGTGTVIVAGSVTLVAGMTYTHTGTVTFAGTGTLTTAGKEFSAVDLNSSGVTLTLGDALNTSTRAITIARGTFSTANYSVTAGSIASANISDAKTITLGSSTVTLLLTNGLSFRSPTNLTFNAGTSQITLSSSGAQLDGGGKTFYNVSFTGTISGSRLILGANTFNNLTLTASAAGLSQLSVNGNQTVNGTFTCAGTSVTQRGFVRSATIGTTRTITCAAVSATDCDFRDITIAGAAAPISPTRGGNCGGNSGITFPAAKMVYRVGTNFVWADNSWSDTSGGTPNTIYFPLAQDTAVINNDTTLSGTLQLTSGYNIGTIDCSTRTTSITLDHTAIYTYYGSYTLGSGVTVSGTINQTFSGLGTMVFTSAGNTTTFPCIVDTPTGTFRLGDAYNSSNTIAHARGTFNANNYNLTCTIFSSNSEAIRTITMGSGLWTLTGVGTVWAMGITTNLTLNKDTANILLSNTTTSARTFAANALSFNKLTIGGATGTSTTTLGAGAGTGSSFTELASTKTVEHTISLPITGNGMTVGTWSITGTAGNVVTLNSSTAGTQRNFNLTNVTSGIDYLSVKDILVNQASRFYVGANSTDGGNNLNVIFTNAPAVTAGGNMLMLFM